MRQLQPQSTLASAAAHRSQLASLLASAFRYPSAGVGDEIASGQFATRVRDAISGLPYSLEGVVDGAGASEAALGQAYVSLFDVGSPAGAPSTLYEGEYGGGRLGVMEDILRFYHFFGLRLAEDGHERPDHLSTELEFLHWLAFQEAEALERGDGSSAASYRSATRDFLALHANDLVGQVARRLAPNGDRFYPDLVRLTVDFCRSDLAYLGNGAPEAGDGTAAIVSLDLQRLSDDGDAASEPYSVHAVRARPIKWDRVVRASHTLNCWYQRACNYNLFVTDGVVLREEQAGNYPHPNDPNAPDWNPRGCNKGACFSHRTYDPARLKYPLKRAGARGEGKWQRISWDQALNEIADKLIDVLMTDGPEAIMQAGGTQVHSFGSEGAATNSFFEALGIPISVQNPEIGDDHQGAGLTFGKVVISDSADNWFHADTILVWSGNPAYTNIPNYHFITEARYRGAKVICIAPDYSPSAIHADLWVPITMGSDGALAMAISQVIVRDGLYNADFIREQTDLPMLVRTDNNKLLRESDLKRGGREDVFYMFDEATRQIVEAPRKTLALNGIVPALEGEYQARTLQGQVAVRPVFEVLKDRLNGQFTPEQASTLTGVTPKTIERLAREIATSKGVVNILTSNPCKYYHGDLIERSMILVFALTGNMGRKGATYNSWPLLSPDTGVGAWERQGKQLFQAISANEPRFAAWKEDGWTTEMILTELVKDAFAGGMMFSTALALYVHGGLLDLSEKHQSWDPHLKRPLGDYVKESISKKWQTIVPKVDTQPRILVQWGGDIFRRTRGTKTVIDTLLPKLDLILSIDFRMCATGMYADYVLPICGWYERFSMNTFGSAQSPFFQINNQAVDPLYDSLSDYKFVMRLAKAVADRARERGLTGFVDQNGKERRFDLLEHKVSQGGLYTEDDEELVARDVFMNAHNREDIEWEDFKERGIAAYTDVGSGVKALNNASDMVVGEPLVPLTWHVVRKDPYPTQTRRIQFYLDHDWFLELDEHLPGHKDSPRAGGDYPLQVTGGHARWSIHTMWSDDNVILALQRGEPLMFMSVKDAADRDIADGDHVEVFNDVGDFRIKVAVSPQVRPGQVMIYHQWSNYQFEGWRHFQSVLPSALNPTEMVGGWAHVRPEGLTFSPGLHDRDSRVDVRKVA